MPRTHVIRFAAFQRVSASRDAVVERGRRRDRVARPVAADGSDRRPWARQLSVGPPDGEACLGSARTPLPPGTPSPDRDAGGGPVALSVPRSTSRPHAATSRSCLCRPVSPPPGPPVARRPPRPRNKSTGARPSPGPEPAEGGVGAPRGLVGAASGGPPDRATCRRSARTPLPPGTPSPDRDAGGGPVALSVPRSTSRPHAATSSA
jgi:hypothetical protein